uniref:Uncharacterized protein n=1 Tax=Eptatretus burgeri TaxID=7764 RepID=A0A8C4QSD6_EPTBU
MDKRSRTNFISMFPFVLLLMASHMTDEATVKTNHEHKSSSTSAAISTHLGHSRSTVKPTGTTPTSTMAKTTGISSLISKETEPSISLSKVVTSTTKQYTTSMMPTETSPSVTKGPLSTIAIILIIVVVVIAVVVIMGVVVVNIQKESGEYIP